MYKDKGALPIAETRNYNQMQIPSRAGSLTVTGKIRIGLVTLVVAALPGQGGAATTGAGMCLAQNTGAGPQLTAITTASGTWRVRPIDAGFVWTLDENPEWSSAMACNESDQDITVSVDRWNLFVPPHACKFAQDAPPLELNPQLIRDAVAQRRWVPYDSNQADAWPYSFGAPDHQPGSLSSLVNAVYNPAAMNGTGVSDHIVGTISGQGGEYVVSRGPADDPDAIVIDRALDSLSISEYTVALYNAAFAFAGYPGQTFFDGNTLRDPQKPMGLLPQYEYSIGAPASNTEVETYVSPREWLTDPYHLANTGWALWLGTEDPRAGLMVQAHAQYMLATFPEHNRTGQITNGAMNQYRFNATQERAVYNGLNAMWRARDVANRIATSTPDIMLWSEARVQEMYDETTAQADDIVEAVQQAPHAATYQAHLKATSSPLNFATYAVFTNASEEKVYLSRKASFMDQQYGAVPMYLRAVAGEPLGLKLLRITATQMVARTLYLGGAKGIDGLQNDGGSGLPLGPIHKPGAYYIPDTPSFNDTRGWAAWVLAQDLVSNDGHRPPPPDDSFKYADAHTAFQTGFILRAAKELVDASMIDPIVDLEDAIAAFDSALSATKEGDLTGVLWHKHMADTFQ